MKSVKIIILSVAISFLFISGIVGTVFGAGASLYVTPSNTTKVSGDAFNVEVGVNVSGNKVCAVEGTIVLKNLSCQNIAVSSGLMSQSVPSCSNPHFLIGIPNCTTGNKVLFTASVTAINAGTSTIYSTGVDIISEGVSVGSTSAIANYMIQPAPKKVADPIQYTDGFIGYVNGKLQTFPTKEDAIKAGATDIQPNYVRKPAEVINKLPAQVVSDEVAKTVPIKEVAKTTPINTQVAKAVPKQPVAQAKPSTQTAAAADAAPADFGWLWISLILIAFGVTVWWIYTRKLDTE